jgi:hypothetical protein
MFLLGQALLRIKLTRSFEPEDKRETSIITWKNIPDTKVVSRPWAAGVKASDFSDTPKTPALRDRP